MGVGTNIKRRRFELKMSQQELADALGYKTRSTIAKIESEENDVSHKKLQRFAAVLDTTVEALLTGYTVTRETPLEPNFALKERNQNIAIILAGGKSGRNRQNIPSQFINVHGKPIIAYCMEIYEDHPLIDDVYVVCLKGWENIVKAYAGQYGFSKIKGIIPAGTSGMGSLQNALEIIEKRYSPEDLVVIQEATRPMVTAEMISKLLQSGAENGSATVCHSMKDYVQFDISADGAKYIDRNTVVALQSPEAHRLWLLSEVFERVRKSAMPLTQSCCTMLLYELGYHINFIESSINNIKIVHEEDIATFSALIKR